MPTDFAKLEEGTILVELQVPESAKVEGRIDPVRFPPIAQGHVQVNVELTRKRRVRVQTCGLPLPYFGFEFSLPELRDDTLTIVITWKGLRTKAFAAGIQVAGPLGEL